MIGRRRRVTLSVVGLSSVDLEDTRVKFTDAPSSTKEKRAEAHSSGDGREQVGLPVYKHNFVVLGQIGIQE